MTSCVAAAGFPARSFGECVAALAAVFRRPRGLNTDTAEALAASSSIAATRSDAPSAARFRVEMLPHLGSAYNLARFLCRDADAAQDIVQEAFLRAFRSFAAFRGGSSRAWILTIVRNCYRDWHVEQGRARATTEPICDADVDRRLPPDEITPETHLLRNAESQEVRRQLAALPEPFREVLVLRELEELSYREIAEVTASPVGTVMSRLARARKLFATAWSARADGEAAR